MGFMSFGVCALLGFGCFVAKFYTPRTTFVLGAILISFMLMSLYPAYYASRSEIRRVVWGQEDYTTRITQSYTSLSENWSWFDIQSDDQLMAIEDRLNHNSLVGLARRRLQSGAVAFADGETIVHAFVALIPRALWPDKANFAGSGHLVSRFTGLHFQGSTSIGIGHVMELYVNFGPVGVFIGFVVLSAAVSFLDLRGGWHLYSGNEYGFLLCFVCGSNIVTSSGGVLANILPSCVGGLLLCYGIHRFCLQSGRED
jgi:hypothetical protein